MSPAAGSRDALRRLDALAGVGLRLARSAPSGRILLAQLALAVDPAWVARPWGDELLAAMDAAARGSAEPLSTKRVEQGLKAAWGRRPTDELDDLDPEPIAVTPTSQVHRATLDGAPVAVKVQRPGLARSVRQDLALLDSLLAPLSAALPALDARGVLREIGERTRDEFDLEHEAANARRLHRALRGHPRLVVPAPVTRLATEDVLVREWVDGLPLDAPGHDAETRDAAAAALVEFVLGGAAAGFMNAGLTPADVLVGDADRVAILDQGVCCVVDRDRLRLTGDALRALRSDAPDAFSAALGAAGGLGLLTPGPAGRALTLLREALGELIGPGEARLDAASVVDLGRRIGARRDVAAGLLRAGAPQPRDIWPARGLAQLFMTIAHVGADGDWGTLVERALAASSA